MLADKYDIEKEVRHYGDLIRIDDRCIGGVNITTKTYNYDYQTVTVTCINGFVSKVEIE